MGCGVSRDAPVAATLNYIPRVEKERDDSSLELVQLKRLGVGAYDDYFTDFEDAINDVVALNNALHDALWDAKANLANAASPDPEYGLEVEVTAESVRSTPQVLLDVLYADGSSRPLPFEIRHLLASRPAVADADRALADAVQDLADALQAQAAPVQLSYADSKQQLTVAVLPTGPSALCAALQQRLQQKATKVNSALAAMRKAAPGLRLQVAVVPSPSPGMATFAWRLLPRLAGGVLPQPQPQPQGSEGSQALSAPSVRAPATPLAVASAHGAAAIMEAAVMVAHQAAAVAAGVASASAATSLAPAVRLKTQAGRRLVAVLPSSQELATAAAAAAAAAATLAASTLNSGNVILRSLSLTRGVPVAAAAAVHHGVPAAAQADEAAAVLRRAVTGANHALFRLAKCAAAGASSGQEGSALRAGEAAAYPIVGGVKLVLDAAIRAVRQVAAAASAGRAATALAAAAAGAAGSSGSGSFGSQLPVSDVIFVDPRVTMASENGSVISSAYDSMISGAGGNSSSYVPVFAREVGSEGLTPGWSWNWEWGVEPRVIGVTFPACLPPKARAVYDSINTAVAAARHITDQLPLVQREVQALVDEADVVFENNEGQLAEGRDMMTAGRLRAALDRNANTITASPALVGLLGTAVKRLMEELRRGAEEMRGMVYGDLQGGEACDSGRPSGAGSAMAKQLDKAAAVAAAAVAAAAADRTSSNGAAIRMSGNGNTVRTSNNGTAIRTSSDGTAIRMSGNGAAFVRGADGGSGRTAAQDDDVGGQGGAGGGEGGGGGGDRSGGRALSGGGGNTGAPGAPRPPVIGSIRARAGGVSRRVMLPPLATAP